MLTPWVSIFVFLAGIAAQTALAADSPTFYRDICPSSKLTARNATGRAKPRRCRS